MMEKITCRIGESQGKNGKQQKALEKASTVPEQLWLNESPKAIYLSMQMNQYEGAGVAVIENAGFAVIENAG